MIWESKLAMTAIDLVIIGAVLLSGYRFYSYRHLLRGMKVQLALILILLGQLVFAGLYFTNLLSMTVFPFFMSAERAMSLMEGLHLEVMWINAFVGIVLISFGLTRLTRVLLSANQALENHVAERRRAKEDLHASQRLMREVFDAIPHHIFLKDLNDRYLMVNRDFGEYWGIDPERPADFSLGALPGEEDELKEFFLETDRRLLETGQLVDEIFRFKRMDGSEIFRRNIKMPHRDHTGKLIGIIGLSLDISEQKRTEDALIESEARFARAIAGTADGIWEWNMKTGENYFSPRWLEMLGYEEGDLEPHQDTFQALIHPEDLAAVIQTRSTRLETQEPNDLEFRLRRKDGDYLWIRSRGRVEWDQAGQPVRMSGSISDISERKEAEENLRASQQLLQTVFDTIPQWVLVKDRNSDVVMANKSIAESFNADPEDFLGRRNFTAMDVPEETKNAWLKSDRKVLREGEEINMEDLPVRLPNGNTRFGRLYKRPLCNHAGEITGLLMVSEDITERIQSERELQERENLLQLVFDAYPDWFYVKDTEGRYLKVNKSMAEFYQCQPRDFIGKTFKDVSLDWKEEGKNSTRSDHAALSTGEQTFLPEMGMRNPDGKIYFHKLNKIPLLDEKGRVTGIVGISQDITEQKLAEEVLRESEAKYRDLVETSQDLIWRIDQKGRFTYLNPAWERTLGYRPDEMLGRPFTDFKRPGEAARTLKTYKQVLKGKSLTAYITSYIDKDGEEKILNFKAKPLENALGRTMGTQGTAHDITERIRAENDLRANQRLLQTIFDTIPQWVFVKDRNNRYLMVNRALADIYGHPPDAFVNKTASELSIGTKTEQRRFRKADLRVLETNALVEIPDVEVTFPGGEKHYQHTFKMPLRDDAGHTIGIVAVTEDTTVRKRAEDDLRANRRLLQTVFDTIPQWVLVKDRKHRYLMVNRALAEVYGHHPDEFVNKTASEFSIGTKKEQRRFRETDLRVLKTNALVENPDVGLTYPNGDLHYQRTFKMPLSDDAGHTIGIVGVSEDITERKQAGEALKHLNETLEQRVDERTAELQEALSELVLREKMATLGQLTATVSHELRNPLGTIRTSVVSIIQRIDATRLGIRRPLDRIERNVVRCDDIITDLLDYSRHRAPKPVPTPVNRWLAELMDEQSVPDWLRLELRLKADQREVPLDREYIRRAVINLYENAVQAFGEGGETKNGVQPMVTIQTRIGKARVTITVKDTGPGIPPEVLAKIFEPLYSTRTYGVGLGLPTVRQIMEQNGGGVKIDSVEGKGTRAVLWLPLEFPSLPLPDSTHSPEAQALSPAAPAP